MNEIGEQNTTVDAGLIEANALPIAVDDEACVCATESKLLEVLANDDDDDESGGYDLEIYAAAHPAMTL